MSASSVRSTSVRQNLHLQRCEPVRFPWCKPVFCAACPASICPVHLYAVARLPQPRPWKNNANAKDESSNSDEATVEKER